MPSDMISNALLACISERVCKKCNISVKKIESALENELRVAILKKAVIFEKDTAKGKKLFKRSTKN